MSVILRTKPLKSGKLSYYLEINRDGKRSYEFLKLYLSGKKRLTEEDKRTRDLAEKLRVDKEHQLVVQEKELDLGSDVMVVDFVAYMQEHFSDVWNIKTILYHLKRASNSNGVIPTDSIDRKWVLKLIRQMSETCCNNTVRAHLYVIKQAVRQAVKEGYMLRNVFDYLEKGDIPRKEETETNFLTLEMVQKLVETPVKRMPEEIREYFLLQCFCGLRFGDLHKISTQNIRYTTTDGVEKMFFDFRQSKTKRKEFTPLSAQARRIVENRLSLLPPDWKSSGKTFLLFPTLLKNMDMHARRRKVNRWLGRWGKAAELPFNLTSHVGRHTYATLALNNGVGLKVVSRLLGHKRIATTERYAKVMNKTISQAVDQIPDLGL